MLIETAYNFQDTLRIK